MSDNYKKFDELRLIFPDKSEKVVAEALRESDNKLEIACDLLISRVETKDNKTTRTLLSSDTENSLYELSVMFPNIDKRAIELAYNSNDKSLEKTVSDLLNFDILSLVGSEEQEVLEKQIKNKKVTHVALKNDWEVTADLIRTIEEHTDVNPRLARESYYDNSLSAVRAIIKIIWTKETSNFGNCTKQKPLGNRTATGRHGRVQSVNGFAHLKSNSFSALDNYEESDSIDDPPYIYSPDSKEAKELSELSRSNSVIKCINPNFLKRALAFYKGNLQRTITLAFFIIESNGSRATHDIDNSKVSADDKGFIPTIKSRPKRIQNSPGRETCTELNEGSFQNNEQYKAGKKMIEGILSITRLDFHGFLPNNAVQILKICLKIWWHEELVERELNSQKLSITNVIHVSPLEVVTGRGIHSVGGVSILKKRVKKFLDENNYAYWEEPSYFTIMGRKSGR